MAQTPPKGKKLFRGPLLYLLIAPLIVLIGWSLLSGSGVREVPTKDGLAMLADGKAKHAEIIDGDQRVNLTLTKADKKYGQDVFFYYVQP
ncbi:cell division protein FtsH, partial [Leucobacter sp. M11]|nr:cell division protein FtsH [Leucobacter sp. M11]